MAERRVLARQAVIVDVGAEFRRVAEDRLELGGDRRVIRTDKGGRSDRRRRRSGEKLKMSENATTNAVSGERSDLIPPPARRVRRLALRSPPRNANIPQALRRMIAARR